MSKCLQGVGSATALVVRFRGALRHRGDYDPRRVSCCVSFREGADSLCPQESVKRARFEPGQLIQHRRYAYRGVVVRADSTCEVDDDWYLSNQTQPDRAQPWYHVLVHGSSETTYVAEENLEEDHGGEQVIHPLAREFFEYFHRGRYQPRQDLAKL